MQMCSYMFIVPPFQSGVIHSVVLFMIEKRNIDIKILSLNVRAIRSFDKRKAIFNWITKKKSDIIFLQETYSTSGVDNY